MESLKVIDREALIGRLDTLRRPYHDNYLALYSSIYGGVVTDPLLMMVPIDDHMVHRGDGIFEAFKCVDGAIYNLNAHLDRLERSAADLDFDLPVSMTQMREIIAQTVRIGGQRDCTVRIFVSRGPGSFGVNPYDSPAAQLYVAVTTLAKSFMTLHPDGAVVRTSAVPVKHPFFAGVKHCNYLNNVLMKKEAVEAGVDFVVAFDTDGRLGEGATENIGIVTEYGELTFPDLDGILMGTTMMRVIELACQAVENGVLKATRFGGINREDIARAREIIIVGTTTNVTRVREFDGQVVGDGKPGPVYGLLSRLLHDDINNSTKMRTEVFS